jgi:hypothetical protein
MREWRANNPVRDAFNNLKASARRRRKAFTIAYDDFAVWCQQTGYHEMRGRLANEVQVDRIDPHGGYTIDNIQTLTCSANTAKGNRERVEEPF